MVTHPCAPPALLTAAAPGATAGLAHAILAHPATPVPVAADLLAAGGTVACAAALTNPNPEIPQLAVTAMLTAAPRGHELYAGATEALSQHHTLPSARAAATALVAAANTLPPRQARAVLAAVAGHAAVPSPVRLDAGAALCALAPARGDFVGLTVLERLLAAGAEHLPQAADSPSARIRFRYIQETARRAQLLAALAAEAATGRESALRRQLGATLLPERDAAAHVAAGVPVGLLETILDTRERIGTAVRMAAARAADPHWARGNGAAAQLLPALLTTVGEATPGDAHQLAGTACATTTLLAVLVREDLTADHLDRVAARLQVGTRVSAHARLSLATHPAARAEHRALATAWQNPALAAWTDGATASQAGALLDATCMPAPTPLPTLERLAGAALTDLLPAAADPATAAALVGLARNLNAPVTLGELFAAAATIAA